MDIFLQDVSNRLLLLRWGVPASGVFGKGLGFRPTGFSAQLSFEEHVLDFASNFGNPCHITPSTKFRLAALQELMDREAFCTPVES